MTLRRRKCYPFPIIVINCVCILIAPACASTSTETLFAINLLWSCSRSVPNCVDKCAFSDAARMASSYFAIDRSLTSTSARIDFCKSSLLASSRNVLSSTFGSMVPNDRIAAALEAVIFSFVSCVGTCFVH